MVRLSQNCLTMPVYYGEPSFSGPLPFLLRQKSFVTTGNFRNMALPNESSTQSISSSTNEDFNPKRGLIRNSLKNFRASSHFKPSESKRLLTNSADEMLGRFARARSGMLCDPAELRNFWEKRQGEPEKKENIVTKSLKGLGNMFHKGK